MYVYVLYCEVWVCCSVVTAGVVMLFADVESTILFTQTVPFMNNIVPFLSVYSVKEA